MGLFKNKNKQQDDIIETPGTIEEMLDKEMGDNEVADATTAEAEEKPKKRGRRAAKEEILEERDFMDNGSDEVDEKSVSDYIDEVIDYFTIVEPIRLNMLDRGKLKKEEFEQDVHKYIKTITKDKELHDQIFEGFASFVWRYDILDELIDDDEISDIKVYDWDHIRIKRLGHRETSPLKFRSEKHFRKFVEHTAVKNKVSISDQNAAQHFVDKESSDKAILRFNITTGFINSNGKYLMSIRKILKNKYTTEKLIELGMFTEAQAEYLKRRISEGGGFLVAGKGGSGKTTLMNWMIDYIPEDCSGLAIQENEELFSNHPDMMFQHTVQNRGEGKIEYSLGDLARNGLLTDIDYFIIGEIKGEEALYLLNAVYTGAKGWASVHGASSTEAMKKLVDYIKYNSDYSQDEALQMLIHLDTVVFMEDFKVKEVSEIIGYDPVKKDFKYKRVY
jgi:pilus assembly protein CpaF